MELKLNTTCRSTVLTSFNRTFMELKFKVDEEDLQKQMTFNRTFMELKLF